MKIKSHEIITVKEKQRTVRRKENKAEHSPRIRTFEELDYNNKKRTITGTIERI